MPRYTDSWVLNNTIFIYLQGGGACICCAPQPLLFSPEKEPVDAIIRSIDDLNQLEQEREVQAVKISPWDETMREQVWGDRGLLRWRMRKEMSSYQQFLVELCGQGADVESVVEKGAIAKLRDFCINHMTADELHDLFTLSRQELEDILKSRYKICSFYTIVFSTVAEQLENFHLTGIGLDAPENQDNITEVQFERELRFDRRRGFCIDAVNKSGDEYVIHESVLMNFLQRMVSLAGPTLLQCSISSTSDEKCSSSNDPSFRSDRRVIRLIIARYWADKLIQRYRKFN
ncbi:hypothetical protein ACHAXN_002027 [Cyclotella atomus]|jgi:hypothetical protein